MAQVFPCVWYRPSENRWRDLNVMAYHDVGRLTLTENMVVFSGKYCTVAVTEIREVSFGKQSGDFVNNWVRVDYAVDAEPLVAFFADGSLRGWGGIFGGTRKILQAVQQHVARNTAAF